MSFWYEKVDEFSSEFDDWYFCVFKVNDNDVNFSVGDIVQYLTNEFVREFKIRRVSGFSGYDKLYCSMDKLDDVYGLRFEYDSVNFDVKFELNKSARITLNPGKDVYTIYPMDKFEVYLNDWFMFLGYVQNVSFDKSYKGKLDGYDILSLLLRGYVRKLYKNVTVGDIVNDILSSELQSVPYEVKGGYDVKLDLYFADGYVRDIIQFLGQGSGCILYFKNGRVYFDSYLGSNVKFVDDNFGVVIDYSISYDDIVNDIWLFGKTVTYTTSETFNIDNETSEIKLSNCNVSNVVVKVNGNQLDLTDYSVSYYDGVISFNNPLQSGDVVDVSYSYSVPLVVNVSDGLSISKYGKRSKKFYLSSIDNIDTLLSIAKSYIQIYSKPKVYVSFKVNILKFYESGLWLGDNVRVYLPRLGIDDIYVVKSIEIDNNGSVLVKIGRDSRDIISWYNEIDERLKSLEVQPVQGPTYTKFSVLLDDVGVRTSDVKFIEFSVSSKEYVNVYDLVNSILGGVNFEFGFGVLEYAECLGKYFVKFDLELLRNLMYDSIVVKSLICKEDELNSELNDNYNISVYDKFSDIDKLGINGYDDLNVLIKCFENSFGYLEFGGLFDKYFVDLGYEKFEVILSDKIVLNCNLNFDESLNSELNDNYNISVYDKFSDIDKLGINGYDDLNVLIKCFENSFGYLEFGVEW